MESQVIVYIITAFQYQDWRGIAPAMPLILSLPDTIKAASAVKSFLLQFPAAVLDGNYSEYTRATIASADSLHVPVWPDIQAAGEAANWETALALGLTGLQTDHPEALIAYLIKIGIR
jgi:glycerophosphoryl diester phosphodiesterase